MHDEANIENALITVAERQQSFVQQLFARDTDYFGLNAEGMKIYRQNLRATATQALSISFPTVYQLIGDELFAFATEKLLLKQPPTQGDWAKWGRGFAEVLEGLEQLDDYPYVADCARLDFAAHCSEKARNTSFELGSANLLAQVALDKLSIEIADSVAILESDFPLVELWNAHHSDEKESYIQAFKNKTAQTDFKQYILVYRPSYKAIVSELSESEYFWMSRLIRGKSVGLSLDLLEASTFNFQQWLPKAIEQNLLVRFYSKN